MKLFDPQTKAIVTSGLLRWIDVAYVLVFLLEIITLAYWRIFGQPTAQQLFVVLVATAVGFLSWIIIILFRLGVMLLRVRADVNLMPEAAARIAVKLRTGDAPTDKKV